MTKGLRRNVEEEVMSVYRRVSPSAVPIEERETFEKYSSAHRELMQYRLRMPLRLFESARVVDFGCGTGELDIVMADWGASIDGFDLNEKSITRAKELASQFSMQNYTNFWVDNACSVDLGRRRYDIVSSYGVIPHVADQQAMLDLMCDAVAVGGFLVLGYIYRAGIIQRWLHREIIQAFASSDESLIEELATRYFGEHIGRSVKRGGRAPKSVIYDYLVNPHYQALRFVELARQLGEKGFRYYSAWPTPDLPFCINSCAARQMGATDSSYKIFAAFLDLRWLFAQREDQDVYANLGQSPAVEAVVQHINGLMDRAEELLDFDRDARHYASAFKESCQKTADAVVSAIDQLAASLRLRVPEALEELSKAFSLVDALRRGEEAPDLAFDHLFHGYNGLGTSYVSFVCERDI